MHRQHNTTMDLQLLSHSRETSLFVQLRMILLVDGDMCEQLAQSQYYMSVRQIPVKSVTSWLTVLRSNHYRSCQLVHTLDDYGHWNVDSIECLPGVWRHSVPTVSLSGRHAVSQSLAAETTTSLAQISSAVSAHLVPTRYRSSLEPQLAAEGIYNAHWILQHQHICTHALNID